MPDYQCDSPRGRWVSEAGIGINLRRIRRAPQLLWESTPKLVLLMICWRSISLMLPVTQRSDLVAQSQRRSRRARVAAL